jgi:MurNAc alpha-1-phosphate uridylyltransferase
VITLTHGMVLAAGLGTRMRPLTEELPKPMLPLGGRTLLDHALDRLAESGVERAVVNAHWRAEAIARAMETRAEPPRVTVLREEILLETGGGVRAALPHLGRAPGFAVLNGDAFWLNGPTPALTRMAAAFDPARMDALLLLVRTAQVEGEVGRGDFLLDPMGRVRRPREREISPYLYGGVQLLAPALFEGSPEGPFSLNRLYDRAIEAERLFALVHDGAWFHLSTPADLAHAEEQLRRGLAKAVF